MLEVVELLHEICTVELFAHHCVVSLHINTLLIYSVFSKKRPPNYNGVVFEILGKHH